MATIAGWSGGNQRVLRAAVTAGIVAAAIVGQWKIDSQAEQSCPNPPVVDVTSPNAPIDVCIPLDSTGNPIAFFDDFSWRSFVALVWPAKAADRGTPDVAKKVTDGGTKVFETFKSDWELFRPNGDAPTPFDVIDQKNPCGRGPLGFDDLVLASFSKFGNLGQAGVGELVHALPAQNKTWLRYQTGFNRVEYEQIVKDKLYLRANLNQAKPVQFANGAIDIKSAWMEMIGIDKPERYYTRTAIVFDPVKQACFPTTVGLVGFHIVVRTASRPQWIWSTFEHVDNVPPAAANSRLAFNDGTGKLMPKTDPNGGFPPKDWATPIVYNVDRVKPVHSSTEETNRKYQTAIGGVWQFYKLVMTQWPLQLDPNKPIPPTQTGAPKNTFPGLGADQTSFANTTLETWEQHKVTTGCMACHTATQDSDFVWALELHAFPLLPTPNDMFLRRDAAPRTLPPALQRLRAILTEAKKNAEGK